MKLFNTCHFGAISTIARYVVIEAVRNRLPGVMLIGLIGIFCLGEFAGGLALTETAQVQGSLVAFIMRLAAVFIIALLVITGMVREFNEKSIDMILALPAPRYVYYTGKLCGFLILAVIVAGLAGLPLFLYAGAEQVLLWSFSLFCELSIIAALCLFFLFTLGQVTAALSAVAAFYLLARSMGSMQLIAHSPILETVTPAQVIMRTVLDIIAGLLPDLDVFTQTGWLVYGDGGVQDLSPIVLQTLIYVSLLAAAALFDLYRRNF